MASYDTVIFDMDGTLLNTLDDIGDSLNDIMDQYGFPKRTMNEIRYFVGNGVIRLLELALPDGKNNPRFDDCVHDYKAHYHSNMLHKTGPYAGIMELLHALHQKKCRLAIVSNKYDQAVKDLNELFFKDYVRVAVGESEAVRKKPAPDSVIEALKELGASAEKALYVGDSEVDIQTAKNAGLKSIGVTWGFRERHELEEAGADFIIDKPSELLDIIG